MTPTFAECVVVLPMSYTGRGPAESCVRILDGFAAAGLETTLLLPRARRKLPAHLHAVQTLPLPVRWLPWRIAVKLRTSVFRRLFKELRRRDPARTIVYFWPDVDVDTVRRVRAMGFRTVRECINNPCEIAKPILDRAFAVAGVGGSHTITARRAADETQELLQHDFYFAPNDEVEASLRAIGVDDARILPTTYGWSAARFPPIPAAPLAEREPKILFVGSIDVRKGAPELLQAWARCDLPGRLVLAGTPDRALQSMLMDSVTAGRTEHLGFVEDIRQLYATATIFVFPTHEEGGPQVTSEAARYGLPIVTTTMGATRLVEDGVSGLIVPRGSADALAEAITRLSRDPALATRLGAEAARRAAAFEYGRVSAARARLLLTAIKGADPTDEIARQSAERR